MKTTASTAAESDTKSRIIGVAERMIASKGAEQVSIRDITREAGVNLAAINYHFGSKERLFAEALARSITAINAVRMALLDRAEDRAGGRLPSVEALLEAFILPLLHTDEAECNRYAHTAKMLSRFFLNPDEEIMRMLRPHFMPLKERLLRLFAAALPELGKTEVEWRLGQVFAIMHHHMLFADLRCQDLGKKLNVKKELRRLVAFCSAGMSASPDAEAH